MNRDHGRAPRLVPGTGGLPPPAALCFSSREQPSELGSLLPRTAQPGWPRRISAIVQACGLAAGPHHQHQTKAIIVISIRGMLVVTKRGKQVGRGIVIPRTTAQHTEGSRRTTAFAGVCVPLARHLNLPAKRIHELSHFQ